MKQLPARLVESLRRKILLWEYPPGHRLLEQEVSDEYGVSRVPAREALLTLAADGFVEKLPRRGYRVRQLDVTQASELYEVRLALELFVVSRLAAAPPRASALKELAAAWSPRAAGAMASPEEAARLDRLFHETLAGLLGNSTLLEHLRTINERIHIFRLIEFAALDQVQSTGIQHRAILAALRSGDARAARTAIEENIDRARRKVASHIKEALARSYLR